MTCKIIQIIISDLELKGKGTKAEPYHRPLQYYSLDGRLLFEEKEQ